MKKYMTPLVSIIIPHFNRAVLLAETISSIKAQNCDNWEVIIVDDGSSEDQWHEIQKLSSEKIMIFKRTNGIKGPSRCRNMGAEKSRGTYFMFVDSDDILAPWCLLERLERIQKYPQGELWIFPVMLFNKTPGDLTLCWNRLDGNNDLDRFLSSDPPWHTSSSFWKKETFQQVGGFNESVFYGDDADLHIKTLLKGVDYKKFTFNLPDVFIRRSDEGRITQGYSQELLESRRIRLLEGTKLLKELDTSADKKGLWEGQYFVEAEELLFNVVDSSQSINAVINDWLREYRPSSCCQLIVKQYFRTGPWFRKHAYILLRLTRRLVMMLLPSSFFPKGGEFNRWQLREGEVKSLHEKLHGL